MSLLPHEPHEVVCVGEVSRTRQQLARDVGALVARMGPSTGPRLVVCEGRYAFAVAMLACWERGEVARLPVSMTPSSLAEQARSVAGVLHDGVGDGLDVRGVLGVDAAPAALEEPPGSQVLVELSTSGSTGQHRIHAKTTEQLVGEARMLGAAFEVAAGRAVLATIPPHHIYGLLFSVLMPLVRGAVCCEDTPFFPEAIGQRIERYKPSTLVTVPAHLRVLAVAELASCASVDVVFSSGAPLGERTANAMHANYGLEVTEVFGSTETGGIAWRRQVVGATWAPLPQVSVQVDGERLVVDSPFVPAEARPYTADDRVELVAGGFRHLGRADDVVKIGSKRVSVGAVERALLDLPGVEDAAVVAVDEGERLRLHAAVVSGSTPAEIRAALLERLDSVAVPRLHQVERLPRLANGKLPRQRVVNLVQGRELQVRDRADSGFVVAVPANCRWFDGHFPDGAVLPGIVQLQELVITEAARRWPDLGPSVGIGRVRFQAPVMPGQVLQVSWSRQGDAVRFSIKRDTVACTAGVLEFGGQG